jgi:hypothetical protein
MTAPRPRYHQPKQLDAVALQAEISSFRLRLSAEGKADKTIRTYTEAVQWLAAASLRPAGRTTWEQVDGRDVQQWMAWLLERYSSAYANNQYRGLTNQPRAQQVNAITTAGSDANRSAPPDHPTEIPQVRVPRPSPQVPHGQDGTPRHIPASVVLW